MGLKDREEGFFTPLGIVQGLGFVLSFLLVSAIYSLWIRPAAENYQIAQDYGVETQLEESSSIYIIIRDYEQQACFTLMVWVLMILGYKYYLVVREKKILLKEERFLEEGDFNNALLKVSLQDKIFVDDTLPLVQQIEETTHASDNHNKLLPHLLTKGLQRFHYSQSIQEASDMIKGRIDNTGERLDSELSIIRYIAWAIPSIGFIGTVRGIGEALANADQALEGDISGVTTALGLAFNSTLVALFISIFLMFFIHSLQSKQEGLILALETFCREHLIDKLRTGNTELPPKTSEEEKVPVTKTESNEPEEK